MSVKNGARLFYTPITGQVDGYTITYGYWEGDERWAVIAPIINNNQGVQDYYIRDLDGGKTYYFKVTAKNGCCVGPWSEWKSVKVSGGSVAGSSQELLQAGVSLPTVILICGSLISLVGCGLLSAKKLDN
ncbi:MAG: fibronectin type III domain-containing protein, partial [Candidatus Shapirobacteria bacterium]|nr:fibronectin type III domain-containing protein [Candidatus Shapirobacteria bacterium]